MKRIFILSLSTHFYINRICEGGNLLEMIKNMKKLGARNVSHIMKQILAAVKYCHNKNIIHRLVFVIYRDIKPENILFSESRLGSIIKVIDFGRSKILRMCGPKLTEFAGSVFTINYIVALHVSRNCFRANL